MADASPVQYLIQLGEQDLLHRLYGKVQVPTEVLSELLDAGSQKVVRDWCIQTPAWFEVEQVIIRDPALKTDLHAGEAAAIQLALNQSAELLLMDDRKGVLAARRFGLEVTGTLGVLLAAHRMGLVNAHLLFERLTTETNFYHTDELRGLFLNRIALGGPET